MTNGDRLRQMDDEKLAIVLAGAQLRSGLDANSREILCGMYAKEWLKYLQEEAKD